MTKKDIPAGADANTKFLIIMDGLVHDSELKPAKDGRYNPSLGPIKWAFFSEKSDGMTEGFLVKKKTKDPSKKKSQNIWLYKACFNKDYEWYFYESFGELVGCELFRYVLGDLAPLNRMTQIPGEAPGIVSKFLPNFVTFKEELNQIEDKERQDNFVNAIPSFNGIPEIIAATCFFNDFDGKFANIGTMVNDKEERKAGRIDYGCSLSNLNDHTYGIGLYLFNEGEFSERFNHAATYSTLLQSEEFIKAIIKLSQINMDHVSAIVKAAVARFSNSWKNIDLDEKAINKLYNHLYGPDKTMWHSGYEACSPPRINLEAFSSEISDAIIDSLTKRKEVFAFFAKTLRLQNELKAIALNNTEGLSQYNIEKAYELMQEAMSGDYQQYIISRLTNQKDLLGFVETNQNSFAL